MKGRRPVVCVAADGPLSRRRARYSRRMIALDRWLTHEQDLPRGQGVARARASSAPTLCSWRDVQHVPVADTQSLDKDANDQMRCGR